MITGTWNLEGEQSRRTAIRFWARKRLNVGRHGELAGIGLGKAENKERPAQVTLGRAGYVGGAGEVRHATCICRIYPRKPCEIPTVLGARASSQVRTSESFQFRRREDLLDNNETESYDPSLLVFFVFMYLMSTIVAIEYTRFLTFILGMQI